MGGSDQWGNIVTGTELIRRKTGKEAFAFTCPLVTKADGGKFGKTEKGNIWLDKSKTSAYHFYQFWLKSSDEDAKKWIRLFTFLSKEETESLIDTHEKNAAARELQKKLAREVTVFVHGEEELQKAIATTEKLFSQAAITPEDLETVEGLTFEYDLGKIRASIDVISFLAETGIFSSKGEARKMIQNGGVSINRDKVTDISMILDESFLLQSQYILVQKGKRNYYLVRSV